MNVLDNRQRDIRRQLLIGEIRPEMFRVRLDGRIVLAKAELESNKPIHVAIGHVVDDLARGPASGAVRGIELSFGEALNSRAKFGGCFSYLIEQLCALLSGHRAFGG